MKKLLVIGGSGFFGKSILDAFARGLLSPWNISKVIVMSRNAQQLLEVAPKLITRKVELYSSDISTAIRLPKADYIVHAATSTDIRDYISNPELERKKIQAGVDNFCYLVRKTHKNSKIVYVSSGAVYGVQPSGLEKISEEFTLESLEGMDSGKFDYAIAKQHAEIKIKALGAAGCAVSIARCFAFIGPWLPRDQHFAIGNFIEDVLNNRPIIVKATHEVVRSYMYTDDLVEWLMAIADVANAQCPTFNVGSDESILLGDLAHRLSDQYEVEVKVSPIKEAKVDRYVPSVDKARNELGVFLKYDLSSAVNKTILEIGRLSNEVV